MEEHIGAGTRSCWIGAAAGAGVGAVPGALGGLFAGAGGILETGSSFSEFLDEESKKKGFKEVNEEAVAAVLEDKEALNRIRAKSAARGGIIAVIDGLTAGVASQAAKGVANTAKTASKLKGVLAATAIEGAGGGVGEATARLAVGQDLDAREIGLEIVGEFGTGVAIGKAALASQPAYQIGNNKMSRSDVLAGLNDKKSRESVAATTRVKNDPEVQAQINEIISKNKNINNNIDILDKDQQEARSKKVGEISEWIKLRDQYKKGDPEYTEASEEIATLREEAKQLTTEQNDLYKGITEDERGILINNKSKIEANNNIIKKLSKPIKIGALLDPKKKKLVDRLNEKNKALTEEMAGVRGALETRQQERAAKAEERAAKKEQEQQEQLSPEDQQAIQEEEAAKAKQQKIEEQTNQVIQEEATDNGQKTDKIVDQMLESNVVS